MKEECSSQGSVGERSEERRGELDELKASRESERDGRYEPHGLRSLEFDTREVGSIGEEAVW